MTSPRSGPSKFTARLHRAERKRQLLDHAKQLFVTLGYQHTTTEKIAHAAGVTEPVLYRHFPSKKALFLEVLEEVRSTTLNRWQSAVEGLSDPWAQLRTIIQLFLGSTRVQAVDLRVMHRTLVEIQDADIASAVRHFYLDTEHFLVQILERGQQAGLFRQDLDPRMAAWELIRTALGFSLTAPLGIPLYQEENYLEKAVDWILEGLVERNPQVPMSAPEAQPTGDLQPVG